MMNGPIGTGPGPYGPPPGMGPPNMNSVCTKITFKYLYIYNIYI